MKRTSPTRRLLWTSGAAALLALAPACGDDDDGGPSADACGEPLYGGEATDEAWRSLVDAKSKATSGDKSITLVAPTEGQHFINTAQPPSFSWTSPLSASLVPPALPASPLPSMPPRQERHRSWLARLGNLLLPTAEAHLPPFTGDIYWVQVTVPGRTCPVEMLTSNLDWQLDATSWATLTGAVDKDLTVQVTSAYMIQNRITEGPYKLATPRVVHMDGGKK